MLRLVDEITSAESVRPISEHVMLHLRHGGDSDTVHLLGYSGDRLDAYAHVDLSDRVAGPAAEVAVVTTGDGPTAGSLLLERLASEFGPGLRIWAHGEHTQLRRLAEAAGLTPTRVLLQMRRSLYSALPPPRWPDGVTVRTFVVGQDEAAWLGVNNRAFADHPDQSGWTMDDVKVREAEPWFDPAGFFLAERHGELVGFHWTKVHGSTGHDHEPIGEVYVVGVDPVMQGQRLGSALTSRGLEHLRDRGLAQVMLYVDEDNSAAVTVYERLGFARWDADVCYRPG